MDDLARLEDIVRSTDWLMRALIAAREVGPPDWLIGSGAVRTAVWDRLHGVNTRTELADVDLAFFDPDDLSERRECEVERQLALVLPELPWEATNQAALHLWYPRKFGYEVEPLSSTAAAVGTWPETAACIGLRLTQDGRLTIEAPLGLEDLFGLIHRRNPARVSIEEYEHRLQSKRISERWPRVKIVPAR